MPNDNGKPRGKGEKEAVGSSSRGPQVVELSVKPKNPVRMRRSVGLILGGVVAVIGVLIMYGVNRRGQQPAPAGKQETTTFEPAVGNAQHILTELEEHTKQRASGITPPAGPLDGGGAVPGPGVAAVPTGGSAEMPALRIQSPVGQAGKANVGNVAPQVQPMPAAPVQREETPAEKARARYAQLEQQAMMAGMTPGGQGGGFFSGTANSAATTPANAHGGGGGSAAGSQLDGLLSRLVGSGSGANARDEADNQASNAEFADKARERSKRTVVESTRVPLIAKYTVLAGWKIPAVLEQSISSDLPGEVTAIVRENVYDSPTGQYLLIPQGSRLLGMYNSVVVYGQERVQVVWTRLVFPDGSSTLLSGMNGQDASGASGFKDKVDHHYKRLVGMALLTSAFSAGVQLSQQQSSSSPYGQPSSSQIASQALGQQMGQMGMEMTRKNMAVAPTIKIRLGYRFNVLVDKDLVFVEPYVSRRS